MDKNHYICMKQSNNSRHSADSSNDNTFSVELQQDDAGVDNPIVLRVESQAGTKNVEMPKNAPAGRPKTIQTRSEQISHRPQRLGIVKNDSRMIFTLP